MDWAEAVINLVFISFSCSSMSSIVSSGSPSFAEVAGFSVRPSCREKKDFLVVVVVVGDDACSAPLEPFRLFDSLEMGAVLTGWVPTPEALPFAGDDSKPDVLASFAMFCFAICLFCR